MSTRTARLCDKKQGGTDCTGAFVGTCPLCDQDYCGKHVSAHILLLAIGVGQGGQVNVTIPAGALGIAACDACLDALVTVIRGHTVTVDGGTTSMRTTRPLDHLARVAVEGLDLITVMRALMAGAALAASSDITGEGEG